MREFFKNLKLHTKFQITIFLVSTSIQAIIAITSYYEGKRLLEERSFQLLISITDNKRQNIERYFQNTEKELRTLAANPTVSEGLKAFVKGFQQIDAETDATDLFKMRPKLQRFYQQEFVPNLTYYSLNEQGEKAFMPTDKRQIILQYHYLANNPNPEGYKQRLVSLDESNSYAEAHTRFHPFLNAFQRNMEFVDVLLIDSKGNVVYSTAKHVDFATNLFKGPYQKSNLSKMVTRLLNQSKRDEVAFVDYEHYEPSYFRPAMFMGTAIYDGDEKIGVLALQLPTAPIQHIITNNQDWEGEGLATTGEVNLIGQDRKIRTNTRSILSNPLLYYTNIKNSGKTDSVTLERIKRLETTILLREAKGEAVIRALKGERGNILGRDFLGNQVLYVYAPIDVFNTRWAIQTEINAEEIFQSVYSFRNRLFIISAVILLVQAVLGFFLAQGLSKPMLKIRDDIKLLAIGVIPKPSKVIYKDELGEIDAALNDLIKNFESATLFAKNIGKGNFDYQFKPISQEDTLGNALQNMKENLRNVAQQDYIRGWVSSGRALFGEILRKYNDDVAQLCQELIRNFVKYLGATHGAIFLFDDKSQQLEMISAYAYDRYKFFEKSILPGEGLVGQAFQEGESIYMLDLPEDYVEITSGLGSTPPASVLIIPIKNEEQTLGVIEVASLQPIETYQQEFAEAIAEAVAATFNTVRINDQTKSLLRDAQERSKQLHQAEIDLRDKIAELEDLQAAGRKREAELEQSRKELEAQNQRLKANEERLRLAQERQQIQESELQASLEAQRIQESELKATVMQLQAAQQEMKQKQMELERSKALLEQQNTKIKNNENVLKKAYLRAAELEGTLRKQLAEKEDEISRLKDLLEQQAQDKP
jgi:hypothetical protein